MILLIIKCFSTFQSLGVFMYSKGSMTNTANSIIYAFFLFRNVNCSNAYGTYVLGEHLISSAGVCLSCADELFEYLKPGP